MVEYTKIDEGAPIANAFDARMVLGLIVHLGYGHRHPRMRAEVLADEGVGTRP